MTMTMTTTDEVIDELLGPLRDQLKAMASYGDSMRSQRDVLEAEVDALRNRLWQGAGIDFEKLRKDSGWPTPNAMRRAADGFDTIGVVARYGDVLRWVADACDGIISTPPNQEDDE